jgi:hypothetical protein
MAKRSSADVGLYLIGGRNVLGVQTQINVKKSAKFEETTPLGASNVVRASVNLKDFTLTQTGFYDDGAGSANEALMSAPGTTPVVCLGISGNVAGRLFDGFSGPAVMDYERSVAVGAFHKATANFAGNGVAEEGVILHPLGTETVAGDTTGATSVDNAVSTAAGGAGYLQVPALTLGGYTNLAVKVRHSADDTTYADLVSFAAVTTAPASERKSVTGTVNRHLASSWAFTGTGTSPSATFFVGFARG